MEFCEICLEQVPLSSITSISCGCQACLDCHLNWANSQLSDLKTYLRCPFPQCSKMLSSLEFLLPNQVSSLRDNQLRLYLTFSKGILWCPNKNCGYAGFMSKSSQNDFFCEKCQECWVQPETTGNKLAAARTVVEEGLNIGWKALFCKTCSGCEVFIEKNQGCRHIDCIMCGTDFCWYCKQSYKTHQQNQCSNKHAELIYHSAIALAVVLMFLKASLLFDPVFCFVYYCFGVPIWCVYVLLVKIFFGVIVVGLASMVGKLIFFVFSIQTFYWGVFALKVIFLSLLDYWQVFIIPATLLVVSIAMRKVLNFIILTPNLNQNI